MEIDAIELFQCRRLPWFVPQPAISTGDLRFQGSMGSLPSSESEPGSPAEAHWIRLEVYVHKHSCCKLWLWFSRVSTIWNGHCRGACETNLWSYANSKPIYRYGHVLSYYRCHVSFCNCWCGPQRSPAARASSIWWSNSTGASSSPASSFSVVLVLAFLPRLYRSANCSSLDLQPCMHARSSRLTTCRMQVGLYITWSITWSNFSLHRGLTSPSACNPLRHKHNTHTATTALRSADMFRYTCVCWIASLFDPFLMRFFPICNFGKAWNPARRFPMLPVKAKQQHHPAPDLGPMIITACYNDTVFGCWCM